MFSVCDLVVESFRFPLSSLPRNVGCWPDWRRSQKYPQIFRIKINASHSSRVSSSKSGDHADWLLYSTSEFWLDCTSSCLSSSVNFAPGTSRTVSHIIPRPLPCRPFSNSNNGFHGAEPSLRSCQLHSYSRTSQYFIEPEGALHCSQEPTTGLYPQPDQSSPYHHIVTKMCFNIIHPPTSWFPE
jgi:hypothetical protein